MCCFIIAAASPMSDEKRLIKYLLNNYETVGVVGRPVLNQSHTIHVNYGLALIQILDLDEKNQVLTTNVWSRYVSCAFASSFLRLSFFFVLFHCQSSDLICHLAFYNIRICRPTNFLVIVLKLVGPSFSFSSSSLSRNFTFNVYLLFHCIPGI